MSFQDGANRPLLWSSVCGGVAPRTDSSGPLPPGKSTCRVPTRETSSSCFVFFFRKILSSLIGLCCCRYKHNASFVTRLPTIRRPKAPPQTHKIAMASASLAGVAISGHIPEANDIGPANGINRKLANDASSRNSSGNPAKKSLWKYKRDPYRPPPHTLVFFFIYYLLDEEEEHHVRYIQLTPQYRMAIRAIRKVSGTCPNSSRGQSGPESGRICVIISPLSRYFLSLRGKLDEVSCGETQVQGGIETLRRQRRHRAVLGRPRWSLGSSQGLASQVLKIFPSNPTKRI